MKVLLVNGSPHKNGCTYTALSIVADALNKEGIDTEIMYLGNKPIAGCIGCGKCVKTCPEKAISLSDNLAYIDDNLCLSCQACVDGCPTHAIHTEIRNNIRETSTPRKETAIC